MEVLHPRCAGLDVHKDTVVASVRLAFGSQVKREAKTFETTTSGLLNLLGWLGEQGLHPCGDGGHRRVLEAGMEYS
jgi:transposase